MSILHVHNVLFVRPQLDQLILHVRQNLQNQPDRLLPQDLHLQLLNLLALQNLPALQNLHAQLNRLVLQLLPHPDPLALPVLRKISQRPLVWDQQTVCTQTQKTAINSFTAK